MSQKFDLSLIKEISPNTYEIPIGFIPDMKVPGIFFASKDLFQLALKEVEDWNENQKSGLPSILQVAHVSTLPGISKYSLAMPDMHSGYGFSIGGVAAFDLSDPQSIVSPGGVGYDINCGVRCLVTNLNYAEIEPKLDALVEEIYNNVPCGVGGKKQDFIKMADMNQILVKGAKWAVENFYGVQEDLDNCEENGCMAGVDIKLISQKVRGSGINQLGTLGSGNHYVEIQRIQEIYDEHAANILNIHKDQIVVMIHCGSRNIGKRLATEFIDQMIQENPEEVAKLPDSQLVSSPASSKTGAAYISAMAGAANFAWCNRQIITHFVRESFKKVLGRDDLKLDLLYDVAHNIAKIEKHVVNGVEKEFVVHRKGATRSFGPNRCEIPQKYREIGQPVLIGGSMGTASYILLGTEGAMEKTFGSTCHGAGRTLSRSKASRDITIEHVKEELDNAGIKYRAAGNQTLTEEAPEVYKDIDEVIDICETTGISKKVARTVPLGVIKG